ncbi:uncharacterized protein [Primulina huaijiensis]|uniref:uncharacterized protein n=1 Tax=Primulina huaijiensis TaxID=1492673 RepID=UPI003CC6F3AB
MTQFFAQFSRNNTEVDRRTRPEAAYERFRKMDPKDFGGTTYTMVAERWIKSIEVIFTFMELQDADRVRCATYLLKDDARLWWEGALVSVNLQNLTWEGFKEVFYSKYFTDDSILRRDVRVACPSSYAIVVTRALAAEQDLKDIETYRQGKRPFQAPQRQVQQPAKKPFQGPNKGKVQQPQKKAAQRLTKYPVCPKCSRKHEGECLWGSGMIYIAGVATNALLDSGATHSFISDGFVKFLDVKPTRLDVSYSVTIPSGEKLSTSSVVRDLSLELQGHTVYADLIVLPMLEFDIILGMDWLSKNGVTIDFQQKSVRVRPLGEEEFVFEPSG